MVREIITPEAWEEGYFFVHENTLPGAKHFSIYVNEENSFTKNMYATSFSHKNSPKNEERE
jgi:hypothetical protein